MRDRLFHALQEKWNETMELPPQTVGPFTPYYKMITKRLKVMPFPLVILMSVICISLLVFLLGSGIAQLASMLQRGF